MSHNLIITNNRDAEYVEFNVNIPDGYNKFSVDYLNGSIINQNYLKVGDTITFKFNNNPIRYDVPKGLINLVHWTDLQKPHSTTADPTEYKYIELDMFKYHKLVFIPIYQCWSNYYNTIVYIFNPCDRKYLRDYPSNSAEDVLIDSESNMYASFTGQYVLAFDKTIIDKLPDTTIVIGESISNSKTRPVDMGSYQLSNNVVNEVPVNTITVNTYNYGSVWRYVVANQVLKHTETINIAYPPALLSQMQLILGVKNSNNTISPATDIHILTTETYSSDVNLNTSQYNIYKLDTSTTPSSIEEINDAYVPLKTYDNYYLDIDKAPYICTIDSGGKYTNIPSGWSCRGDELTSSNIYKINPDGSIELIDTNSSESYIVDDWIYTGKEIQYTVQRWNGNKWIQSYNTYNILSDMPVFLKFGRTYNLSEITGDNVNIRILAPNSGTTRGGLYLCKYIPARGDKITYQLNTGVTTTLNLFNMSVQLNRITSDMLQLSGYSENNTEDIYVEAVTDSDSGDKGIRLSTKHMRNILHNVEIENNTDQSTNTTHPYNYIVTNTEIQWNPHKEGDIPIDLQAFVPMKTNKFSRELGEYDSDNGWFIIGTISDGSATTMLTDDTCEIYLATGHESLNVEPPDADDLKFKTFNGTLVFDRSNTKITRLFSNDLTGACLGYINDILAARLSRYYFCCNYIVFNTFLDIAQRNISFSNDLTFLNNIYSNSRLFTGYHEIWMSNSSDLVKLIGSENVVNNCMSSLYAEEQEYNCLVTYPGEYNGAIDPFPEVNDITSPLYYKLFHFYTSGLKSYPDAGLDDSDSANTTCGGVNLMYVPGADDKTYDNNILNDNRTAYVNDINARLCEKPIFVNNLDKARANRSKIYDTKIDNKRFYTNSNLNNLGVIETLPAFRLYRNSNFEQTDLTITTGGIKLLHPIYLQSTPRILVNNLLLMLDTIIESLLKQYGSIVNRDNTFGFINVLVYDDTIVDADKTLFDYPGEHTLVRFGTASIPNNDSKYVATSLDSLMLLNYMHGNSLNDYQNIKELNDSLPTSVKNNEEIIADLLTNSIETNVQLFSYKYFNFLSEVSPLSMVVFNSMYVETVPFNADILSLYWDIYTDDGKTVDSSIVANISNTIQGYINNSQSFNNIKTCKVFICKLGEFLDFPRILYAGCNSYNNTLNVTVWNYDSSKYIAPIAIEYIKPEDSDESEIKYKTVFKPEQKVNTTLFGVMFRYHQLSHGYQNFPNELTKEYVVSKSLGNRTFTLILYDEFGRRIPNEDTNQGFKNNLYIELALE